MIANNPVRIGRTVAWLAAVLCAGCPPFPEDGTYRCERDSECATDLRCVEGACVAACAPLLCADVRGTCGDAIDDGCGSTIACGCRSDESCNDGRCEPVCVPRRCIDLERGTCGAPDDGCGGVLDCPCEGFDTCGGGGTPDRCGCTPAMCGPAACGTVADGCGTDLSCGQCTWPQLCTSSVCGRPEACIAAGAVCGFVDGSYCGACRDGMLCGHPSPGSCGRPAACTAASIECGFAAPGVHCGGCAAGEVCTEGRCVERPEELCWSAPELLRNVGAFEELRAQLVVTEVGLNLLGAHDTRSDTGPCNAHTSMPMLDDVQPSTAAAALLASADFSDLDTSACPDLMECIGWVSVPHPRADGLEMFLHASMPCRKWWDRELYLSHRTSPSAPWSKPTVLPVTSLSSETDPAQYPVLLPDQRTLVYYRGPSGSLLHYARRASERPGDTGFVEIGSIDLGETIAAPDRIQGVRPQSVSCDGLHLLYYRAISRDGDSGDHRHEARRIELQSIEPLRFGLPEAYEAVPIGTRAARTAVRTFAEAPGCTALFYSTEVRTFTRRRVACP